MPIIHILPHAEYCPAGAQVRAASGTTICEALLENGIAIEHACDMSCACTTCHVIVREGLASLNEAEETEEDLLDRAWGLEPNSRLSCQAIVSNKDLVVEIPKYSINHAKENHSAMRQVFLDTETTGLFAEQGDRVIEIGCVELVNRKLTGNKLHLYVNPERDSHEEALRVHGISNDFLRDKPKFAQVADELLAFIQDAELIIHNAPFDIGFLNRELTLLAKPPLHACVSGVIDTLLMAKEMFPGKRNSLDALCTRLEVDNSGRQLHGALLDAELLAEVYINMTRGQDALLMDSSSDTRAQAAGSRVDFSTLVLSVLAANEQELQAHAKVLVEIDKASAGKTVWPRAESTV